MLDDDCDIKERWSGVDELIERWLKERQDLIVQYCGIAGVHEFSPQNKANVERLRNFCQLLVDYVSAGHFEVYYQLLREAEAFDDGSAELGKALFPYINSTTESALDFNDRFDKIEKITDHGELAQGLSQLGEVLASRFEFEDRLIKAMHAAHRELVA